MTDIKELVSLPLNQVLQGDCIETLEHFPPESVDLIFADPPYNLQLHQELWRPNLTRVDGVDDDWDQFADFMAYDQFTKSWLTACRRVLKRTGTLWVIGSYHNIFRVGAIMQDLQFWILNTIVWVKDNPMPNFRGVRFTNAHETLIWAQKERGAAYTFNHHSMKALNDGLQMRSDWNLPICSGKERLKLNGEKVHSTQKPEALLYRLLLASSEPGAVVLDPFFGTGTTGAVAKRLRRQWIGIEREARYVEIARQRIETVQEGSPSPYIYHSPNPRKRPRIPFGRLVESDLLKPGDTIYFGKTGEVTATVLADGAISYQGERGSIHQIARQLRQAPCNGWEQWYFYNPQIGERQPIDRLRQLYRQQYVEQLSGEE
jgi:site-specific DNA-methyltransferase (adenine-specific)